MPKGSDLLVAALENEGVDRIFGIPGEENLDVVESLRTSKIELVLTRHEQAASFMAATHGRQCRGKGQDQGRKELLHHSSRTPLRIGQGQPIRNRARCGNPRLVSP